VGLLNERVKGWRREKSDMENRVSHLKEEVKKLFEGDGKEEAEEGELSNEMEGWKRRMDGEKIPNELREFYENDGFRDRSCSPKTTKEEI
jgi:Txe/YoeB family toxin of Txe-Axe toxin-antitoxin module